MPRKSKPKYSARDDLFTLYQTLSVRDIAKKLRVDRRTVQRWKNEGMTPSGPRREKLHREAQSRREEFRREGKKANERWNVPPLAVPVPGDRQMVKETLTKEEWEKKRARAKSVPRFKHDQFAVERDARGRRVYVRRFDAGAVVFNVRKLETPDLLRLLQAIQGQGRSFTMIHELRREYKMKDGTALPKGSHLGSRPEFLDSKKYSSPEAILEFINDRKRKGKLIYLRVSDPAK